MILTSDVSLGVALKGTRCRDELICRNVATPRVLRWLDHYFSVMSSNGTKRRACCFSLMLSDGAKEASLLPLSCHPTVLRKLACCFSLMSSNCAKEASLLLLSLCHPTVLRKLACCFSLMSSDGAKEASLLLLSLCHPTVLRTLACCSSLMSFDGVKEVSLLLLCHVIQQC